MKLIYVTIDTILLDGDSISQQLPTFLEIEINEDNETHYQNNKVNMTDEDVAIISDRIKAETITALWNTCQEYQSSRIETLGVLKLNAKVEPNTKALEILQWIELLWMEYYTKRTIIANSKIGDNLDVLITIMNEDDEEEVNGDIFDFRQQGELPYSYAEAMAE